MARLRRSASPETVGIRNMMGGAAVQSNLPPIPSKISTAYGSPVEAAPKPTRRRAGASLKEVVNDIIVDARIDANTNGDLDFTYDTPSQPVAYMARRSGRKGAKKNTPTSDEMEPTNGTSTEAAPTAKATPAAKGKGKGKKPSTASQQGDNMSPDPISEPNNFSSPAAAPRSTSSKPVAPSLPIIPEEGVESPAPASPSLSPLSDLGASIDGDLFNDDGTLNYVNDSPSPARPQSPKHPRTESTAEEAEQSPPLKKQRNNPNPFDESVAHVRHRPNRLPPQASTLQRVSNADFVVESPAVPGHRFPGTPYNSRVFGDAESIMRDLEAHRTPPPGTPKAMIMKTNNPLQDFSPGGHPIPPTRVKSYYIESDGSLVWQSAAPSKYDPIALNPNRQTPRHRYPLPGTATHSPGGARIYYSPPAGTLLPSQSGAPSYNVDTSQRKTPEVSPSPEANPQDKGKGKEVDRASPTPEPRRSLRPRNKRPPPANGLLPFPDRRPRSRSTSPPRDPSASNKRDRSPIGDDDRRSGRPGSSGKRPDEPSAQPGYPVLPVAIPPVDPTTTSAPRPGLVSSPVKVAKPPQTKPNPMENDPPRSPSLVPAWLPPKSIKAIPLAPPAEKPTQEPSKGLFPSSAPAAVPSGNAGKGPAPVTWKGLQTKAPPLTSNTGNEGTAAEQSHIPPIYPAQPASPVQLPVEEAPAPRPRWLLCLLNSWPFKRHAAPATPGRPRHTPAAVAPGHSLPKPVAVAPGHPHFMPTAAVEDVGFIAWALDDIRTTLLMVWIWLAGLVGGIWGTIINILLTVYTSIAYGLYTVATWLNDLLSAIIAFTYDTGTSAYASVRNAFARLFGTTAVTGTRPVAVNQPGIPAQPVATAPGVTASKSTRDIDFWPWRKALIACILAVIAAYLARQLTWVSSEQKRAMDETFPPPHSEVSQGELSFSLWPGLLSSIGSGIASLAYSAGQYVPTMPRLSSPTWSSPTESAASNKWMRGIEQTMQTLATEHEVQNAAIGRLDHLVPKIIHADLDDQGRPKINNLFFFALVELLSKDEEILTLQKNADGELVISDALHRAIKKAHFDEQWVKNSKGHSDDEGSGMNSGEVERIIEERLPPLWEKWLSRNNQLVQHALANNSTLITREQFLAELQKELNEHRAQVMTEVNKYMEHTGGSYLKEVFEALLQKHGLDDLTQRRIETIVEDMVRQIVGSVGLTGLSKSKVASILDKRDRGVNYFVVGTGAHIDVANTSPGFEPPSFKYKSEEWRRDYKGSSSPAIMALKPWEDYGDCWCGSNVTSRDGRPMGVTLSVQFPWIISPNIFVLEHIPAEESLEPEAVPKQMELWANIEDPDEAEKLEKLSDRFFQYDAATSNKPTFAGTVNMVRIGQFTYRPDGGSKGAFEYKIPDVLREAGLQTDHVIVRAVSNVGGIGHTCIYRVKLYGVKMDLVNAPNDSA
ncbi:hypothetical protein F5X68DRAFT_42578 [Plectosphaerella plurivora]|uniref:SUN domain-containing protein n=1 Tax=Plectosphaerella plurivora TaxID=936078 RepID=A0A9P8V4C5_9PEZI|nr:hypothetical protein F5X68DRAFT_42578 [Plectosphaerella plurivora]